MSFKLYAFVAVAAGGGAMFAMDRHDLHTNYVPAKARITQSKADCYVKSRGFRSKKQLIDKTTGKLAYMDCTFAPMIAVAKGFDEDDVKRRVTLTYVYVSPVDGSAQKGSYTSKSASRPFREGDELPIRAHKTEPSTSRVWFGDE